MTGLTADQVTQMLSLPQLSPLLPGDTIAVFRAGLPLPLYYGTITELLNSVTSLPSGSAPLSGTEIVYVIQNGVPVQIPVSDIGSGGGGGVAATYYGRCSD